MPASVCRRHNAIPIGLADGVLRIAMSNPGNVVAVDDFRTLTRMPVEPVVATHDDVAQAIDRYCRADTELEGLQEEMQQDQSSLDLESIDFGAAVEDDAPIVRFVNLLITQAIQDRASDIHIEPAENDLRVRYRIDGVLHEMQRAPKAIAAGVTSRLKIMSDIDIAERRKPQDGRLSVKHQGRKIDLRVATLPTVWGEKVVMRILDNSTATLDLEDLGLRARQPGRVTRESYTKPYGMILVTGPTGSGKSTTLYATLNQVARPEINVITVEDPVEYRIPGINQVQVNVKAGLTFASALRSILRSDPDVVLVGEIRDHETAQIAIEAALTGHLVLSTLHTNDAPSRDDATHRDGHRAVPRGFRSRLRRCPAARAPLVLALFRGARRRHGGSAAAVAQPSGRHQDAHADEGWRLQPLLQHRLPRACCAPRNHARRRDDRAPHGGPCGYRRHPPCRSGSWHGDPHRGRLAEGYRRHHVRRGTAEGGEVIMTIFRHSAFAPIDGASRHDASGGPRP